MKLLILALAALAAVAVAVLTDEADAQTMTPQAAALMAAARAQPARTADAAAFAQRYDGERPLRLQGVAQTAVDAKLAGDDAVGSLGFLCGIKPGVEQRYGAAAARGYDDTGRFVGAKLRLAFR